MLKNILATVGLHFVAKKGYEHYQEYIELKREKEERDGEAKQTYGQQADSQSHM